MVRLKTEALQDLDDAFENLVDALLEISDENKDHKINSDKFKFIVSFSKLRNLNFVRIWRFKIQMIYNVFTRQKRIS